MAKLLTKFLGVTTLAAAALLFVVVNFSAVETHYECRGTVSGSQVRDSLPIFMRLERYRWWVGSWGDSDGSLWYEIPNETVGYFGDIAEAGDQLQIYESGRKSIAGNFSTLSKALFLRTPTGIFDGICNRIDA